MGLTVRGNWIVEWINECFGMSVGVSSSIVMALSGECVVMNGVVLMLRGGEWYCEEK